MNLIDQLIKNHTYFAVFLKNEKKHYTFFQKKDDNEFYDVITNEKIDIRSLVEINPYYDVRFFKFLKKINKNGKINTFEYLSFENFESDASFYNILSFFGFKNNKILFEKEQKKEILENVITKIKNYCKRYIGQRDADLFANYLKLHDNVLDILTVIPEELLSKNVPFWIKELYNDQSYYKRFKLVNFSLLSDLVEEKILIESVLDDKKYILNKTKKTESDCIEKFKQMCLNLLKERIRESETVLLNEKYHAEEKKDNDLLFEINVITEEMDKLKIEIEKIDFTNRLPFEWWPELLYPIQNGLDVNDYVNYNLINKLSKIQERVFNTISEESSEKIKKAVLK
jgi:hypothetical protein